MADWHGYIGLENLGLNLLQRATLVAAIRQLGPASDSQPARLCHWRTRLDGEAVIFEALFSENNLTIAAWKQRLGTIFGVDPDAISHSTVNRSFGRGTTPAVTFSRAGTDYLRVVLFGGMGAGWGESGDETRGYLAASRDDWESVG